MAAKQKRLSAALEEHSRALTTGVVDVLERGPTEGRDEGAELALRLARQDQRIEGLPLKPIAVEPILASDGDSRAKERHELERRFAEIERLIGRERKVSERLREFGEVQERERNETRARWGKWIGSGSVVIGGLIALMVLVPAAIPIVGGLLGWLVGKIPSLASAVGVVSVKAYDAVVRGIERTKGDSNARTGLGNEVGRGSASDGWLDALHLNLSREMDADHKTLVRMRKAKMAKLN